MLTGRDFIVFRSRFARSVLMNVFMKRRRAMKFVRSDGPATSECLAWKQERTNQKALIDRTCKSSGPAAS
jgi:hypothetical protein